jgi:hypothetical protein
MFKIKLKRPVEVETDEIIPKKKKRKIKIADEDDEPQPQDEVMGLPQSQSPQHTVAATAALPRVADHESDWYLVLLFLTRFDAHRVAHAGRMTICRQLGAK